MATEWSCCRSSVSPTGVPGHERQIHQHARHQTMAEDRGVVIKRGAQLGHGLLLEGSRFVEEPDENADGGLDQRPIQTNLTVGGFHDGADGGELFLTFAGTGDRVFNRFDGDDDRGQEFEYVLQLGKPVHVIVPQSVDVAHTRRSRVFALYPAGTSHAAADARCPPRASAGSNSNKHGARLVYGDSRQRIP